MNKEMKSSLFTAMGNSLHKNNEATNDRVKGDIKKMLAGESLGELVYIPGDLLKTAVLQAESHKASIVACISMLEIASKDEDGDETEASKMYKTLADLASSQTLLEKVSKMLAEDFA